MTDEGSGFIRGFNDPQEMWEYMRQREEAANEGILPPQREIVEGSYFFKMENNIAIFGKVDTLEERVEEERRLGADENEIAYFKARAQEMYDRNYRTGNHFSWVCPEGEYGDSHIVSCWPITQEDFEFARDHGWKLPMETALRITFEMDQGRAAKEHGE